MGKTVGLPDLFWLRTSHMCLSLFTHKQTYKNPPVKAVVRPVFLSV